MLDFYTGLKDVGDKLKVISIDPGVKHFAIRVELIDISAVSVRELITYEVLLYELIDFDERIRKNKLKVNDFSIVMEVSKYLNENSGLFEQASIVLIENQMKLNKGTPSIFNYMISYFMNHPQYVNTCVIGVSPKFKGKMLNLDNSTKSRLKKDTIDKMTKIFEQKSDQHSLNVLDKHKKKDDLCDAKAMIEALLVYMMT